MPLKNVRAATKPPAKAASQSKAIPRQAWDGRLAEQASTGVRIAGRGDQKGFPISAGNGLRPEVPRHISAPCGVAEWLCPDFGMASGAPPF